jgi:hypothetical protein
VAFQTPANINVEAIAVTAIKERSIRHHTGVLVDEYLSVVAASTAETVDYTISIAAD